MENSSINSNFNKQVSNENSTGKLKRPRSEEDNKIVEQASKRLQMDKTIGNENAKSLIKYTKTKNIENLKPFLTNNYKLNPQDISFGKIIRNIPSLNDYDIIIETSEDTNDKEPLKKDTIIRINRQILSWNSEYFNTMFAGHFKESGSLNLDMSEFPFNFDLLSHAINFCYGVPFPFAQFCKEDEIKTFFEPLDVAEYLAIPKLIKSFESFLEINIKTFSDDFLIELLGRTESANIQQIIIRRFKNYDSFDPTNIQNEKEEIPEKVVAGLISAMDMSQAGLKTEDFLNFYLKLAFRFMSSHQEPTKEISESLNRFQQTLSTLTSFEFVNHTKEETEYLIAHCSNLEKVFLRNCAEFTFPEVCLLCKSLSGLKSLNYVQIEDYSIPEELGEDEQDPQQESDNPCFDIDDLIKNLILQNDHIKTLVLSGDSYPESKKINEESIEPSDLKQSLEIDFRGDHLKSIKKVVLHLCDQIVPFDVVRLIHLLSHVETIEYSNEDSLSLKSMQDFAEVIPSEYTFSFEPVDINTIRVSIKSSGDPDRSVELKYLGNTR